MFKYLHTPTLTNALKGHNTWRCICIYKSESIHVNDGIFVLVYMTSRGLDIKIDGELLKSVKIMRGKARL